MNIIDPIPLEDLFNGAIDGGDDGFAALCVAAHPRSSVLPQSTIRDLWALSRTGECRGHDLVDLWDKLEALS